MESHEATAQDALIPGLFEPAGASPSLGVGCAPSSAATDAGGGQCDAALAELRDFRVTAEGVSALARHSQNHPASAGCAALSLGARMMYHEQLKAYLDQELEMDTRDAIERFAGTSEAELLKHALAAFSAYASEDDVEASRDFFKEKCENARADEKYPHFKFLWLVASHRTIERRAVSDKEFAKEVKPLSAELDQLSRGRQGSVVLRQARARMGL